MLAGLEDFDWGSLVQSIEQGTCVLMLGPDVITERIEGRTRSVGRGLAEHLIAEMEAKEKPVEHLDPADLGEVADAFVRASSRLNLTREARLFFEAERDIDTTALDLLAGLPFELIVTTDPGSEFEAAINRQDDRQAKCGYYDFKGGAFPMAPTGSLEEPLVYHLYGSVHYPRSMALSESDLLTLLVGVAAGDPPLPENIKAPLRTADNSFLFLGFGLKHWYLKVLLHVLAAGRGPGNPSYALEAFEAVDERVVASTTQFYQRGHNIHFFEMDLGEFAAELDRQCQAPVARPAGRPAAKGPVAFICHASEDADKANALAQSLEQNGVGVWLDRQNLRGGNRWDEVIRRALDKEIGYVLVVHTQTLVDKRQGYVNRELAMAIDRSDEFRDLNFLIPVILDEAELIPQLDAFQGFDLRGGNVKALASEIKRDWSLRKRLELV